MAEQKPKFLAVLGYSGAFLFLFLVCAYLSFPYQRLRDYLVAQVNNSSRGPTRTNLHIGELSPAPLLGVHLYDVRYQVMETRRPENGARTLSVDNLTVKASLFSLLFGDLALDFESEVGAGTLEGSYEKTASWSKVQAELENLDLAKLGLGSYLSFPVEGVATGQVEMTVPEDIGDSTGAIDLRVAQLALGDGKAAVKVPGMRGEGFIVERINAGTLKLNTTIEEGNAKLDTFEAKGPDLNLHGNGSVRLMSPASRSRLNLALEFKFSEDYKNRDDRTKALFELMGFRPELKRATTPDGALRFELKGFLQRPRGVPAGNPSRGPRPPRPPRPKR